MQCISCTDFAFLFITVRSFFSFFFFFLLKFFCHSVKQGTPLHATETQYFIWFYLVTPLSANGNKNRHAFDYGDMYKNFYFFLMAEHGSSQATKLSRTAQVQWKLQLKQSKQPWLLHVDDGDQQRLETTGVASQVQTSLYHCWGNSHHFYCLYC